MWTGRFFMPVAVLALLCPLLIVAGGGTRTVGQLPAVRGGDEPHYLVMIHSLIDDGDLNLSNNYASVQAGSLQAGRFFQGAALDHHTAWYVDGRYVRWGDAGTELRGRPEHSAHPAGLALVLAPLLFAFRDTRLVEPAALLCSALAILLAFYLFRRLLVALGAEARSTNLVAVAAFFAAPAWYYGRTLFSEPYLLLFAVGSYAAVLGSRAHAAAGILIALGVLMKPPFVILAIPLAVLAWRRSAWAGLVVLGIPVAAATAVVLWLNQRLYGSPWNAPQPFEFGNPAIGLAGLLFSVRHGIVPFAPVMLLAAWGWWRLLKAPPRERVATVGAGFLLYLGLMACWHAWDGGWCYGPRLVIPVIPFLAVGLLGVMNALNTRTARVGWHGLLSLSVFIQVVGIVLYDRAWNRHPLLLAGDAVQWLLARP